MASYYDQTGYDYGAPDTSNSVDPNTGAITTPDSPNNPAAPTDPNIDPSTGLPYPARTGPVTPRHGNPAFQQVLTPDAGTAPVFSGGGGTNYYPGTPIQQDPRFDTLVNQLVGRATQSLNIDPLTDPVIRPQVDNYGAAQTRAANKAIDSQAESGSPYATGAQQAARTQANEQAGFNTANLQSTLMTNELTARRNDIQQAMSTEGQLLTADQQLKLQQELGLIDANLKQQGINSGNDQFLATLDLNTNNQNNYWNAIGNGTLS